MSRTAHIPLRALAVAAAALSVTLGACRDPIAATPTLGAMVPYYDFEMTAAIGETIDMGPQILIAEDTDVLTCASGAPEIAHVVEGTATIVARGTGDAVISCMVTRAQSPGQLDAVDVASYYQIHLRVR